MPDVDESELVAIAIDNYLTKTDKVTKDERSKMNKITDHYAKTNQHLSVIKQIFTSFKKNINKQNFTTICKRFLILIDEILELSCAKQRYKPYSDLISQRLVQCFLHVFSLIFHYKLLEASLDWKVYRMLWAKSIKDEIFDALRQEIAQKYRNFDLNRGFTQQSIERIKKRYTRKNFTQQDIKRYMEPSKNQIKKSPKIQTHREPSNITNTRDASESSSSNEEIQPKKRDPRSSLPIQKKQVQQPPQIYGFRDTNQYLGSQPQTYLQQNSYIKHHSSIQPVSIPNHYMSYHQPKIYPPPPLPPPANGYINTISPYHSPYQSPYRSPDPASRFQGKEKVKVNDEVQEKSCILMRRKMLQSMLQCRQCGLFFQSKQNYMIHQEKHFHEAQHELQSKQYSRANQNLSQNAQKLEKDHHLCSVNAWKNGFKKNQEEIPQQISINYLPRDLQSQNCFTCYFCQEELRVVWCEKLQNWALGESVKLRDANGRIKVGHQSCFAEFVSNKRKNKQTEEIP